MMHVLLLIPPPPCVNRMVGIARVRRLNITVAANKTLEERLKRLISECDQRNTELSEAKTELTAALAELDIVIPENVSLKEQLQAIVDEIAEARRGTAGLQAERDALSAERDELSDLYDELKAETEGMRQAHENAEKMREAQEEKVRMLTDAVTRLGNAKSQAEALLESERAEAKAREEATEKELAELRQLAAGGGEELRKERARADELEREIADVKERLERGCDEVGVGVDSRRRVGEQLQLLITATVTTKAENADLRDKVHGLTERVSAGDARIEEMKSELAARGGRGPSRSPGSGPVGDGDVDYWRCEAEALAEEAEKVIELVMEALRSGSTGAEPDATHLTTGKAPTVSQRVEELCNRFKSQQEGLETMNQELSKATATITELKLGLEDVDHLVEAKVKEVREEARQRRAKLVEGAVMSLSHLRSHLIFALSGLREAQGSGKPRVIPKALSAEAGAGTRMAWHPFERRWTVRSEGQYDQLVLKLAVPKENALGIRAVAGPVQRWQKGNTFKSPRGLQGPRPPPPAANRQHARRPRSGGHRSVPPPNFADPNAAMHMKYRRFQYTDPQVKEALPLLSPRSHSVSGGLPPPAWTPSDPVLRRSASPELAFPGGLPGGGGDRDRGTSPDPPRGTPTKGQRGHKPEVLKLS